MNTLRTLPALAVASLVSAVSAQTFQRIEVDQNRSGDVKLVGDIDLDGTPDIVLGGRPTEGLSWYRFPSWQRTLIAVPSTEFTTDGELGDVDGDGDLDIVVPDGSSGVNLEWYENPRVHQDRPDGDPSDPTQWRVRSIGSVGSWCKDVELADFDRDGRLDVAARERGLVMIFFRTTSGGWTKVDVTGANLGNEGLASGDIDGDGDVDLVTMGHWLQNPGGANARNPARWNDWTIDGSSAVNAAFKALVHDIDRDGHPDVLFSSSESTADVAWYSHGGNPTGTWQRHVVEPAVERAHTLQAADLDLDGDVDIVVGQMHTATAPELVVYHNDGTSLGWTRQVVDAGSGIHNGVLADLGADGDLDIVGANWTGNPPLRIWENLTPRPRQIMTVTTLRAGQQSLVRISNVTPNAIVVPWVSLTGTTTPYPTGLGTDFDLARPSLLAWRRAGVNGVADFDLPLPNGSQGVRIWFQSLEIGHKSNVVDTVIQ